MNSIGNIAKKLRTFGAVYENEPLCKYTTFCTGGPADLLVDPDDSGHIPEVLNLIEESGLPLTVIGGGSNLLVSDRGVRGAVLVIRELEERPGMLRHNGGGIVYADASVRKERFIRFALENKLCGMEFMAGIPGCIGGGIIMNAGTFMGSFAGILDRLAIVDRDRKAAVVSVTEDMSSYRHLKIPEGAVVTGGYFRLGEAGDIAETKKIIDEVLADRGKKHPLDYPSAGSVFKNPEGHSSWKLIDDCGLKGYCIGGAQVSTLHTNFIINASRATSQDIFNLIRHVQDTVNKKFGIALEAEVRMIGIFE